MARPVKFTREIILEMAKRYFELRDPLIISPKRNHV